MVDLHTNSLICFLSYYAKSSWIKMCMAYHSEHHVDYIKLLTMKYYCPNNIAEMFNATTSAYIVTDSLPLLCT